MPSRNAMLHRHKVHVVQEQLKAAIGIKLTLPLFVQNGA